MNDDFYFIEENFPQRALGYVIYGDPEGLTATELEMVDRRINEARVTNIFVQSDEAHFSGRPAFGLPCDCEVVYCYYQN